MRAADNRAAGIAGGKGMKSSPVNKQNRLPAVFKITAQTFKQSLADCLAPRRFRLGSHIHRQNLGQNRRTVSFGESAKLIFAAERRRIAFNTRSCRRKQKQAFMISRSVFCDINGIVARRLLGFICVFLLLVNNYQPDIFSGSKNRAPCPIMILALPFLTLFHCSRRSLTDSALWKTAMSPPYLLQKREIV